MKAKTKPAPFQALMFQLYKMNKIPPLQNFHISSLPTWICQSLPILLPMCLGTPNEGVWGWVFATNFWLPAPGSANENPKLTPIFWRSTPSQKQGLFQSKQGLWIIWGSRYILIYKHKETRSNNENPPGLMPFMNPTTATNRVLRHLTWNLMFGGWWGQ